LSTASLVGASVRVQVVLTLVSVVMWLLIVPTVYLVQIVRANLARWRLALIALDLERTLDTHRHPAQLQEALATVLGDSTLRLAYPLDDGSYVDIDGRPTSAAPAGSGRAITPVCRRDHLFAVIDHDEALHQQREVAQATVAVAGLAIENAHLYATMRAQIEEIRTSRLRLATAAFDERRRIQRDLHDGAQQRLFAVLVLLDVARHHLGPSETSPAPDTDVAAATTAVQRAHSQLGGAIKALRELTGGIYPEPLVDHGLAAALDALCDLSPIPVWLDVPATRWSRHIEFTAYFVVAEALANVYKHAQARNARVTVRPEAGWLAVAISDDGCGGAIVGGGSGLRGLQDRVAAVGGRLDVTSAHGTGTRIGVQLPLESP
jgi:signal transduction histidine kinase